MKNTILSFIVVYSILFGNNVYAQTIADNIIPGSNTQSVPVSKKERKVNEIKYLILGGMAINASQQTSGFVMLGAVKTWGGYIKAKTDLNFDDSFVSKGKSTDNRYFTDETEKGRYALTGGLLWRAFSPIIVYGGLGYGNRWINWKTIAGDPYRVKDISYNGFELETGLILKIKMLAICGGVSVTSFNYLEANLGIGIIFGKVPPKIKASRVKAAHGGKR